MYQKKTSLTAVTATPRVVPSRWSTNVPRQRPMQWPVPLVVPPPSGFGAPAGRIWAGQRGLLIASKALPGSWIRCLKLPQHPNKFLFQHRAAVQAGTKSAEDAEEHVWVRNCSFIIAGGYPGWTRMPHPSLPLAYYVWRCLVWRCLEYDVCYSIHMSMSALFIPIEHDLNGWLTTHDNSIPVWH